MTRFVKAHACGNDFLIVERDWAAGEDLPALARRLCDRHTGVGADGIEFLEWTGSDSGTIHLFNADGTIAELSGNGTRCVAAWMAFTRGAASLRLLTDAGERVCEVIAREGAKFRMRSAMGAPSVVRHRLTLASGVEIEGAVVGMGNPQFVTRVHTEDFSVAGQPWQDVGRELCGHADFPSQTNVEFLRVIGAETLAIRIYERGVGPTQSSGTGTCAAAAAAMRLYGCASALDVQAPGGVQRVEWDGPEAQMFLTGPAELICQGEAF